MEYYKHRQVGKFLLASYIISGILGIVSLVLSEVNWGIPLVLVFVTALIILFSSLTVKILDDVIELSFGIGIIKKRFKLSEIHNKQIVKNHWYYGWGIRLTPHGWLYNISGLMAIQIEFNDGKKVRIGTDEPEKLLKALNSKLAN